MGDVDNYLINVSAIVGRDCNNSHNFMSTEQRLGEELQVGVPIVHLRAKE